ncbi:MAG: 2-amino-4-hydroxy-6-hydroxymethyldihydropteridine diphosphokinase, partial [Gammaproteobacteria bacterium]
RTLDLDLLLYGSRCMQDARLTVPHQGLPSRAFVIVPLLEIAPQLSVPGLGKLSDLCARINVESIRKLPGDSAQPASASRNLESR